MDDRLNVQSEAFRGPLALHAVAPHRGLNIAFEGLGVGGVPPTAAARERSSAISHALAWGAGVSVNYSEGRTGSNDPRLKGLPDVKGAAQVSGYVALALSPVTLEAKVQQRLGSGAGTIAGFGERGPGHVRGHGDGPSSHRERSALFLKGLIHRGNEPFDLLICQQRKLAFAFGL